VREHGPIVHLLDWSMGEAIGLLAVTSCPSIEED
jgi:hypothetical protein